MSLTSHLKKKIIYEMPLKINLIDGVYFNNLFTDQSMPVNDPDCS